MTISVRQRYKDLVAVIHPWILKFEADVNSDFDLDRSDYVVDVNHDLIYHVAVSTQIDIKRFKDFHLSDGKDGIPKVEDRPRADAVKRAAYTIKWITRLRPLGVVILNKDARLPIDLTLLNESFACHFASVAIGAELKLPSGFRLTDERQRELIYDLHYRNVNEDYLLALFQIAFDAATGEEVVTGLR